MTRIFIVDDEPTLTKTYTLLLEHSGHEVIGSACDGVEAVEKFKSFPKKPQIILMDHRMPNKNGLEATEEILEIHENSYVIFVSADLSVKDQALKSGAVSFLAKTFQIKMLLRVIDTILKNGKK